jgi:hypothetical protein
MTQPNTCYKCHEPTNNQLHGYFVCPDCITALALHQDNTIQRNRDKYRKMKQNDMFQRDYIEDVNFRLKRLEEDYISKRIKLLHIKERLEQM